MAFRTSIFYRVQLKIIKIYNLIWTSVYTLKCKFDGHILDSQKLSDESSHLVFCTRRGCKFSHIKDTFQGKQNEI